MSNCEVETDDVNIKQERRLYGVKCPHCDSDEEVYQESSDDYYRDSYGTLHTYRISYYVCNTCEKSWDTNGSLEKGQRNRDESVKAARNSRINKGREEKRQHLRTRLAALNTDVIGTNVSLTPFTRRKVSDCLQKACDYIKRNER